MSASVTVTERAAERIAQIVFNEPAKARLALLARWVRKALTECIDKRGALIAEFECDQTAIRVHRLATPATPPALHSSPPPQHPPPF